MNNQTRIKWLWLPFLIVLAMLLAACGGAEAAVTQSINTVTDEAQVETAVLSQEDPVAETAVEPTAAVIPQAPPAQPANDPLADLFAQEQAYVSVYEQVNPAVVNINTGDGQGSGFLFDNNGHIVTNNHVVEGSRSVTVTFDDGNQLPARIVGTDPASDLAVLQVDASQISINPVKLADSDALKVGQIVIAIGSPFGLQSSMTTGIVSALDRLFPGAVGPNGTSFQIPDIIQTDAAINPGNSGGPLLNLYGEVIGVNTAIESPVRGSSGIGYAVPANIVSNIVPQIIANGRVETPWLGISGGALTENTAVQLGLPASQQGVLISEAIQGGAAAAAGLRGGNTPDVIVGIDDTVVTEIDDLLGYLVQHTVVGQTVTLQILRDGQLQTATLTLLARP
jgi:2-alkenal reductase